jgi:hypothetical protein
MKQLLIGIAIVAVLGTGGFVYRYEIENPKSGTETAALATASSTNGAACSTDAKICPDGTAVGRTGPNCSFAVCAPPNVQLTTGSSTLAFVLPSGYQRNIITNDDATYLASYIQSTTAATDASSSIIDIHVYPVPTGQTAGQVILYNTTFLPSGQQATTTSSFSNVSEGSSVFSEVVIGNDNGTVQSAYYLAEPDKVIRFDITELGVSNWNDPSLDVNALPQHQALEQMLATLQIDTP